MIIQFYKELKDDVKDDLYRENMPDTFIEYIQYTIKIDDHLYIYRIKKYSQRLSTLKWTSGKQKRQPLQANIGRLRQMLNTAYRIHIRPIDLNVAAKNQADNRRKKYYNCNKKGHFAKDCRQPKKLSWKLISQKNVNIVETKRSIAITERIPPLFDFGNTFISISLNVLNIKLKKELDID